jgi:hypothetical protein
VSGQAKEDPVFTIWTGVYNGEWQVIETADYAEAMRWRNDGYRVEQNGKAV